MVTVSASYRSSSAVIRTTSLCTPVNNDASTLASWVSGGGHPGNIRQQRWVDAEYVSKIEPENELSTAHRVAVDGLYNRRLGPTARPGIAY